jgi:RNA polymerase sigma-70 factor (ECF subfamily)
VIVNDDRDWTAREFEANRPHLRAVAYRMLGSFSEADDAVQEAWLRLSRAGAGGVDNLGGWLTTVVARVCLDMLRSRKSRREEPLDDRAPEPAGEHDPEQEALLAESVGMALLVVLERLAPAERVAFVLHDMFDLPFEEIAPIVGRSSSAARQLASRARRRVHGSAVPEGDLAARVDVVRAFLAASRDGDMRGLLAALDPGVVLRGDPAVPATDIRGAEAVAQTFCGRAKGARPALVDGAAAAVWAKDWVPQGVFAFTIREGSIVEIALISDPDRLARFDIEYLER